VKAIKAAFQTQANTLMKKNKPDIFFFFAFPQNDHDFISVVHCHVDCDFVTVDKDFKYETEHETDLAYEEEEETLCGKW
jgi:hypothetical protein